jgi:hypothetical protein
MARADIAVKETGGRNSLPTDRWVVASGQTLLIKAGEPTKQNATGDENVILQVDADLTVGTDQPMAGIAATDSTETAAASGYSEQYVPLPDIKWEIKAKSAAAADTQSEIDALVGSLYIIDLTASVFTMDTAAGNTSTNAYLIVGGDANRSTVFFRIRPDACSYGRATV